MSIFANKLSDHLLDINFQAINEGNKRVIKENANMFGFSWIGDGATIKRMSLLNMLAMCGSKPPTVIAILDLLVMWWMVEKKMLNSSCPFSKPRLMSLIQERHLPTPKFLMG